MASRNIEYRPFNSKEKNHSSTAAQHRGVTQVHQPFVRKRRFSMLATLELDKGIIAAQVVEGSFTRDFFLRYLRDDLVCIPSTL